MNPPIYLPSLPIYQLTYPTYLATYLPIYIYILYIYTYQLHLSTHLPTYHLTITCPSICLSITSFPVFYQLLLPITPTP